jgi:tight adherence protein B
MTLAALTFAVVFGVVLGMYWFLAIRPESMAQSAVQKRLKSAMRPAERRRAILAKDSPLSELPVLNRVLLRTRTLGSGLQSLLDRAGLQYTVGALVLACAVSGVLVYVLINRTTHTVLAAMLIGSLAATGPYVFVRWKADARMRRFEELFPEAISLIIRAMRAGHGFTTGLAMVADELGDPVGPEFRLTYDRQNFGMPLEAALTGLAERVPLLDVRFFVTAVLTQRDAGGNLAEVLENISTVIRDRFKVKRQVRVVTAHARITGVILSGMPVAAALAMMVISPKQMKLLWTDPLGMRMILGALVLQIVGAVAIRRIVDIEY